MKRLALILLALGCSAMTHTRPWRGYEIRYRIAYDWGVVDGTRYQVEFAEWSR